MRFHRLLLLIVVLLLPLISSGQDAAPTRRLILKDGSYQLVTKYEVKGDRVRYYSSEREDWEELPNSLVDWRATEQWEKDREANLSSPEAKELDKEIEREQEAAAAVQPMVAPGLRLPEDTGVFLLDTFQGEAQIVEVAQSAGDVNQNTKRNVFRDAISPITGLKVTIELDGAHAKVQAHVEVPSLYIRSDESPEQVNAVSAQSQSRPTSQPEQPEQPIVPFDRFRIVKVEVKGNKRIVGNLKRQVTGKITQDEHWVKTTITNVKGGWLKVTPIASLSPGEYALVEMMGTEGMNLYLWDFGVNPKAPANANPWKPEAKSPAAPSTVNQ